MCPGASPDLLPGQWTSKLISAYVTDSSGKAIPDVRWIPTTTTVFSDLIVNVGSSRIRGVVTVNGLFHAFRSSGGRCGPLRAAGTAYLQRYLDGRWQNMIAIKNSDFVSVTLRQQQVLKYRWVDVTPTVARYSTVTVN